MKISACNLSLVPLRADASHRSEMVSQVLFGELFEIIEEDIDFVKVKLLETNYQGWIQKTQFAEYLDFIENSKCIVDVNGASAISSTHQVRLVHGTTINSKNIQIGNETFEIVGSLRQGTLADFEEQFPILIEYYLNSPYLWGGCSSYGVDCSGFSQLIYRHFAVGLPRDAWQQAEKGVVVNFLTEIKKGDLAFFDNEAGHITHVGVMIDPETIIHASGRVRIDKMDSEGIYNSDLKKYTHRLRIVKRYF